MSYLVLARKWRPQVFEHIRGQEHIVRALQNAIRSGRIAHAYMFTGTRGIGKTSAARVVAKALNCVSGPTAEPCNICESCREITEGKHPDVLEIDGASNNSVEDVRRLRDQVRYPPVKGRYRVYIIDEVHMLSGGAFNALLKTLEEPPRNVVFIFATTDAHKVPVTILSRCQEFDFKALSVREMAALLGDICKAESIAIEPAGLTAIAREADGSVRDGQSLLDQVISYSGQTIKLADVQDVLGVTDRTLLLELAAAILARDVERVIRLYAEAEKSGLDAKRAAVDLLDVFRDLTVLKSVPKADDLVDLAPEETETLAPVLEAAPWEEIHARYDMLMRGVEVLRNAPRQNTALEMTLIKMARMPALIPFGELSGRAGAANLAPARPAQAPQPRPAIQKPSEPVSAPFQRKAEAPRATESVAKVQAAQPPVAEPAPITYEGPPDGERIWTAICTELPGLKSVLCDHGRLVSWDITTARLVIEVDVEFAFARNRAPEIEKVVTELIGRRASVEVKVPEGAVSTAERQRQETDLERAIKRDAMDHPMVQKALDVFGAELDGIKRLD